MTHPIHLSGFQRQSQRQRQRGLSIIELMIAIAIGLIILSGLSLMFVNSSASTRELVKTAQQLENGRYAIETLRQDLVLAGFYGQFATLPTPPAVVPDPCATGPAATLLAAVPIGVQIIDGGSTLPSCIPAADHKAGTDIIVIRRASTQVVAAGAATVSGEIYIQGTPVAAEIQTGNGAIMTTATRANGAAASTAPPLLRKDNTAAPIRKYNVMLYYVAPCSIPAGGGTTCTGAADDLGKPIPSLKRRYLTVSGGVAAMVAEAVVEGIENLQVEVGIDESPSAVGAMTGFAGDGNVDRYSACTSASPCTAANLANVVAARVYVLARNTEGTPGYLNTKTYALGALGAAFTPSPADFYKRHVYSTELRIVNMAGRRES